jgi:hypothetical protein
MLPGVSEKKKYFFTLKYRFRSLQKATHRDNNSIIADICREKLKFSNDFGIAKVRWLYNFLKTYLLEILPCLLGYSLAVARMVIS